jgi:hypothetical protein
VTPTIDSNTPLWNLPGQTSTDAMYRRHKFTTFQGWYHWPDGWNPKRTRDAVTMHVKGWPYFSAALCRDLPKYPPIFGALKQRFAPSLRATWLIKGPTRAPGRYAVEDLRRVWREQFRPDYADTLRTLALMGGQWIQVWWEYDAATGVERPRLERWPWEACIWRGASPAFPGGWYALTVDSGIVRMVPGDGHWLYVAHSNRAHEMGAVIALGTTFVTGELARRDEAGLSEAAGRAAPYVELREGVQVQDEIGLAVQEFVEEFGLARTGGVLPNGNKLLPFQITSDTDFFKNFTQEQLTFVLLVIVGQLGTSGAPSAVYQNLSSLTVAESLVDEDQEATQRAWQALARAYCEINGQDFEDSDGTELIQLVGERYADANAKAEASTKRATSFAMTVKAWRDAGLKPTQDNVDALAAECSTFTVELGPPPQVGREGGTSPAPSSDGDEEDDEEPAPVDTDPLEKALGDLEALGEEPDESEPEANEEPTARAAWEPKHDEKGRFAATGRSKAAGEAKKKTREALEHTKGAKDKAGHDKAAQAHREAAAHHEAASKASRAAHHREAHARVAAEHKKAAEQHEKHVAHQEAKEVKKEAQKKAEQHGALVASGGVKKVILDPSVPADSVKKMTSNIRDPQVLEALRQMPLSEVRVGKIAGQGLAFGICSASGKIQIDHDLHDSYYGGVGMDKWDPAARNPLKGERKEWSTTVVCASKDEMRELTFAHELGHHVHFATWSYSDPIVKKAYENAMATVRGPVTEYAHTDHQEYFAESFALYNRDPAKLKRADPIGHKMVRDVLDFASAPPAKTATRRKKKR